MLTLVSAALALQLTPSTAAQEVRGVQPESITRVELPELGTWALDHRRVLTGGQVQRWAVDANGVQQSAEWLEQQRRTDFAALEQREQRLAPTLREHLATLGGADPVEVAFWLRDGFSASTPARRIEERTRGLDAANVPEVVRTVRRELLAASREAHAEAQATFEQHLLNAGGRVVTRGGAWPVVIAEVPSQRVAELAGFPEVDRAYRSMPVWEHEGDNAQATLRTQTVLDQGVSANGSVVRFLVNDTSEVVANNPYLPPVNYLLGTGSNSYHATAVAGNVANNHPLYAAASAGLPEIWSAGQTGDSNAPIVWEAAILNGIDFGNCSWWNFLKGDIEFLDRFFDYTIRNFGVMMFKSNGNQGNSSTPYGTTPGQGYNMLSSGNYSDGDNLYWEDDQMASSSSYWNPVTGHEKPEVSSPGSGVTTTGVGSDLYFGFGGTSSASPLTAGVATLLASAEPALLGQMTTVKALLMASAWHNVEGDALISDKDGAGGVHAAAAWSTLRDGQYDFRNATEGDFPNDVLEIQMELVAGDATRVTALWFSNPDSAYSTDVLEMDLDMAVLDPSGAVVAASLSAVNPFEHASFVPATSGTYRIALSKQRFDGTAEPLSVVWSSRSDAATAVLALSPGNTVALGSSIGFSVSEPFEGAGSGYAIALSGGNAPAFPLPGGFTLPSGFDATTSLVLTFPGATGVLDGAGSGGFTAQVPSNPAYLGLTFRASVVVFGGTSVDLDDVYTTSTAQEITITN